MAGIANAVETNNIRNLKTYQRRNRKEKLEISQKKRNQLLEDPVVNKDFTGYDR